MALLLIALAPTTAWGAEAGDDPSIWEIIIGWFDDDARIRVPIGEPES